MTVNRFYKPTEIGYIDTYVPINFDQLYKIGVTQKAAVDEARKELAAQQKTWAEFQSLSDIDMQRWGDLTYNNPVIRKYVERAAADPDAMKDAAFRAGLQQAINNLNYTDMGKLKQQAENYEVYAKNAAALQAEGRYDERLDPIDIRNWDTLNKGMIPLLSPTPYKSLLEIVKPYVDGLKPSFIEGNVNPITGQKLPFAMGYNAITADDLYRSLDMYKNEIVRTPQGKMWYEDTAQQVLAMNPNATQEDIDNAFNMRMMSDASYKLIATPVMDEFAQQSALLSLKQRYENSGKQAQAAAMQLSREDQFASEYSMKLKQDVFSFRQGDPTSAGKYTQQRQQMSTKVFQLAEQLFNTNPSFNQAYQQILDYYGKQGADVTSPDVTSAAIEYAFQNAKLSAEERNAYGSLMSNLDQISQNEIQEAMGRRIQVALNNALKTDLDERSLNGAGDPTSADTNPFKYINKYVDGQDLMYDSSVAHQMWNDGLYEMSQEISPQTASYVMSGMFKDDKKINEEVGYSLDPRKLQSPKQFIYKNNNYIQKLAADADFDVLGTHLDRNTLGSDNFDIEELAAKGAFGKVAVNEIKGYVDTPNGRNFTVSVNIPLKGIKDHYGRWWAWDTPENTLRNYGFVVTEGSGLDEDGVWKNGYVTVDMVWPVPNHELDKVANNLVWEKELGTSDTKNTQRMLDDQILINAKNFQVGYGLKQ